VAFGLPIALDVAGRHAVVVGGGVVGETRTRTLLEAGAAVTVISDRFTNGLQELSKRGEVTLLPRACQPGDLEGAFLAVAATNSPHVNRRIHAEADELRVLLNAVNDSEHSHFAFPSVLRRGDLQVAISTGGRAPALARWLRKKLSRSVGAEYGELVDLLTTVRHSLPASVQRLSRSAMWARRWEQALDDDLLGLVRSGRTDQAPARARRHLLTGAPPSAAVPRVAIVGAGPGDAGLLTERARTLIDEADVVVFDRLVSPDLVEGKHAVHVGKGPGADPGRSGPAQAEINMLLVLFARQGKRVVRLNGGDPFVFGRGAEEAEALAAAGIDFEIVPAPTSAIATLAYAGIPVTDRHCASSLAIVTGQSAPGREVHWRGLATAADTIVVLMGTAVLAHIVDELIAGGLDSQTPSAIVENGTTPMQRVIVAPIGDLPARAAEAGVGRRMSSLSER